MSWRERIQAARERGRFTADDENDAASWLTCAVGEQHAALPEVVVYISSGPGSAVPMPADATLFRLGAASGFNGAVNCGDFDAAERLLDAIEDRALQLKREGV